MPLSSSLPAGLLLVGLILSCCCLCRSMAVKGFSWRFGWISKYTSTCSCGSSPISKRHVLGYLRTAERLRSLEYHALQAYKLKDLTVTHDGQIGVQSFANYFLKLRVWIFLTSPSQAKKKISLV
ncbi:hypothetical protein CU098_009600 [Rhizopus stolonifer]|uniref:Uncharacterized protein n=1 Tax=Rhizopus stolonifer TaxID=4846 RepID=A0A367JEM8_RHIST|nr:hypothetical protein CU098_009600 [Rhizopus stolonifer]